MNLSPGVLFLTYLILAPFNGLTHGVACLALLSVVYMKLALCFTT